MVDSETNTHLGKRQREDAPEDQQDEAPVMPPADVDDSSDDEIGPMPTMDDGGDMKSQAKKKKRSGGYLDCR